jgi:hypothetical protein
MPPHRSVLLPIEGRTIGGALERVGRHFPCICILPTAVHLNLIHCREKGNQVAIVPWQNRCLILPWCSRRRRCERLADALLHSTYGL